MGVGDLILDYATAREERKAIEELIQLLDEDYRNAQGGIQKLKDFIEGDLVDGLQEIITVVGKWCVGLIDIVGGFLNTMASHFDAYEKADSEGAQLLKEAIR